MREGERERGREKQRESARERERERDREEEEARGVEISVTTSLLQHPALDPPLWIVPTKASLSLSLSLS